MYCTGYRLGYNDLPARFIPTMNDTTIRIVPNDPEYLEDILELSMLAWAPVFPRMKEDIPDYVYAAFYPEGWRKRQLADISEVCRDDETSIWVALKGGAVAGYMGVRVHDEDSMGEIYVIAVHPDFQRQGICTAMMSHAFEWLRERDLAMVMVETGGDAGHASARAAYENAGFERYPVARYFRKL